MAGPFSIQRTPRGLLNVIGNYGGETPPELAPTLVAMLDVMQMYGLQQQQSQFVQNAALAAGANVLVTVPDTQWWILFHCFARFVAPVGLTNATLAVVVDPNLSVVAHSLIGGLAATNIVLQAFVPPYPLLLPPGARIGAQLSQLIGAAAADVSFNAVVGVLG